MGFVVAARHIELGELFAIKCILPGLLQHTQALARFTREARAAVRLKSQHVGKVHDVGRLDNGTPFMVMEYLEGEDLKEVLKRQGTLSVAEATQYVLQALEALAEAHASGIVHRDLKPANLFLTLAPNGLPCLKVLDFGVSKIIPTGAEDEPKAMTSTQAVLGSPAYMSPEQLRSAKDVDARSDIWSLGIILYELLTGDTPFRAKTYPEQCVVVLQNEPEPLSALDPDIPAGLSDVVLRCLRKEPDERFQTVAEFALRLAPFVERAQHSLIDSVVRVQETTARRLSESVSAAGRTPPTASGDEVRSVDTPSQAETSLAPSLSTAHSEVEIEFAATQNSAPGASTTAGVWGSTGQAVADQPHPKRRAIIIACAVGLALAAPIALVAGRSPGAVDPLVDALSSEAWENHRFGQSGTGPASSSPTDSTASLAPASATEAVAGRPARRSRPAADTGAKAKSSASASAPPAKTVTAENTAQPSDTASAAPPPSKPKIPGKKNPFGTRY